MYDYQGQAVDAGLNEPAASAAGFTCFPCNLNLQPATTTYRGGDQVAQQYDTRNELAQVSSGALYGGSVGASLHYDAEGRLLVQVYDPGTTATQYTYDGLGRLTSDSDLYAQAPPPECGGWPPPIIGDGGVNCVEYCTWQNAGGVAFTYDSVGNRRDQGGTYTAGNRIQSFAGCTYTTDADGDVTARSNCGSLTATFKWTAESRLDTVVVGGQTIGYHYDAGGRLVRKDVNGSAQTYFLWNGDNLLAELSGSGTTLVAEYSYYGGLDNLHAIVVNGVEYDAHSDVLGNVQLLTDSAQSVKRIYGYDDWGNLTGGADNLPFNGADRARWKGALWLGNEANLYYMRARWYEPATGRFLSEDPKGLVAGVNPYVFSGDDPVNGMDPFGTQPCPQNFKPVGIENVSIEINGREFTVTMVKCESPSGDVTYVPTGDYDGPLPVGGGSHTIDWGDQTETPARPSVVGCFGSAVAFGLNGAESLAIFIGASEVAAGILAGQTGAIFWGLTGADATATFASAGRLFRGSTIWLREAVKPLPKVVEAGGEAASGHFRMKALVPIIGLGAAWENVADNCPELF